MLTKKQVINRLKELGFKEFAPPLYYNYDRRLYAVPYKYGTSGWFARFLTSTVKCNIDDDIIEGRDNFITNLH